MTTFYMRRVSYFKHVHRCLMTGKNSSYHDFFSKEKNYSTSMYSFFNLRNRVVISPVNPGILK